MKLTTVLLIAFCLQASAAAFSQRVTLNAQNTSLEKVFKEIKKLLDPHNILNPKKKVGGNTKYIEISADR